MHKEKGLTTQSADTNFPSSHKKAKVSSRTQAEVIECRDVTADLKVIKVRPEVSFTFQPGQYVKLEIGGVKRRYSLVSAPHERFLEFFIERVPDGKLSPQLWRLGCGDLVTLRPRAKGKFLLDPRFSNHLMLATVTGIGPFVSILRSYLSHKPGGHRFYVLHGASYHYACGHPEMIADIQARSTPKGFRVKEERYWKA